ncbi:hypothetical protein [Methylocaldum marinum]|uniref:hypothetical protein n=1 Tax=Methylocaldum marinum TaxID=1432792 RepID=UPI0014748D4F|nr:hypothetical protein [Methylocaldum marinum]
MTVAYRMERRALMYLRHSDAPLVSAGSIAGKKRWMTLYIEINIVNLYFRNYFSIKL